MSFPVTTGDLISAADWNMQGSRLIATDQPTAGSNGSFTSIPGDFNHLMILGKGRRNTSGLAFVSLRVNGDSGSNYLRLIQEWQGDGTQATSFVDTGSSYQAGQWGSAVGSFTIKIFDYTVASADSVSFESQVYGRDTSANADNRVAFGGGRWAGSSVITSIDLIITNGFTSGSMFSLYGWT